MRAFPLSLISFHIAKEYWLFSEEGMRFTYFMAYATAAAALSACGTTGGEPAPVLNAPGPVAAALNTSLGPLSYGNPDNGRSVTESFTAVTTSITVRENLSGGLEFVQLNEADYTNTGVARFDQASNTLTLDIQQGDIDILDTLIGPLLLADPGDFANIENDTLAVLIAAKPELFAAAAAAADPLVRFDPVAFSDDIHGADAAIEALKAINNDAANEFLESLSAVSAIVSDSDFFLMRVLTAFSISSLKQQASPAGPPQIT